MGTVNFVFLTLSIEEGLSFRRLKVLGDFLLEALFKSFHHGNATPRGRKVDFDDLVGLRLWLRVELEDIGPSDFLDHFGKHVFSKVHEVVKVSIGIIELAGSVFRVVSLIDTLIPKILADLKDSLKASNHAHLQVELRGDSHVKSHVEVIVVGGERPSRSTTGYHVHHGSLNLDEVQFSQVPANESQHL